MKNDMIVCRMLQSIHQKSTHSQVYVRLTAGSMDTSCIQYPSHCEKEEEKNSQIKTLSKVRT